MELRRYQTADGRIPLAEWLEGLRDGQTRARIVARLDRLRGGLFGDWKSVGAGVYELRIDHGLGYRVFCTQTSDIEKAHGYWKDHKARKTLQPPIQGGDISQKRRRNRRLH
jgi:putative component of toxin-antitoxin plasmid stabilization module